jgi:hypothetical protein
MPFDEKRELLQTLFVGEDGNGKRYGVYVKNRMIINIRSLMRFGAIYRS